MMIYSKKTNLKRCIGLCVMSLALIKTTIAYAELTPRSADMFYCHPNSESTLEWNCKGNASPKKYLLKDFTGKIVADGIPQMDGTGISLKLKLPQGYYDIVFPETGESFGLIALPDFIGKPDLFFGIDTAWSWLEKSHSKRGAMLKILRNAGIGICRERMAWGEIKLNSSDHYHNVRKQYLDEGIKLLEVHHDCPVSFNNGNGGLMVLPTELGNVYKSWRSIAKAWNSPWVGFETWNEEDDTIFCGDMPPDRYASYHKTVAAAISATSPDTIILNGGFTSGVAQNYLDELTNNDLLSHVDAVAFHYYKGEKTFEQYVSRFRQWLATGGRPRLPLWLTEVGVSWKKNSSSRPKINDDIHSAVGLVDIVCQARALGISAVFPFVFAYYPLENPNFSMLDKTMSPLRQVAAYFHLTGLLSNSIYVGKIVESTEVFKKAGKAIIVVRKKKINDLPRNISGILYGIDGRELGSGLISGMEITEELSFLVTDWSRDLDIKLNKAYEFGQSFPVPIKKQQLIMQFLPAMDMTPSLTDGYTVSRDFLKTPKITIRVWNFSDKDRNIDVISSQLQPQSQSLNIAANAHVDVNFSLNGEFKNARNVQVRLNDGTTSVDRLAFRLNPAMHMDELLKKYPSTPFSLGANNTRTGIAVKGKVKTDIGENSVTADIDLTECVGTWNNWATIIVALPRKMISDKSAMIFRSNCSGSGWAEVLWILRNNDRFSSRKFPVNSCNHDIYLPFANPHNKYLGSYNKDKANKIFNPEDISAVEFVVHSRSKTHNLTISNIHFVKKHVDSKILNP
ncbi:MAG: hypothetical protein JXR78_15645 [Victivallales bacterium]|nr:hypothetical protein [Victivallales bacterium]